MTKDQKNLRAAANHQRLWNRKGARFRRRARYWAKQFYRTKTD